MKVIKVAGATEHQLDWLVAKCEGLRCEVPAYADTPWVRVTDTSGLQYVCPDYSTDWAQGGPTPLIAAMRCYVSNCLGSEVEVPEELL